MSMKFKSFIGIVVLITASTACVSDALADEASPSSRGKTIPEVIDEAANQSSGDFFESRSLEQDAAFTFGIGYDEDKLAKDAQQIQILSEDLLNQQASDGPLIRTQDLVNPYNTSVRETRQANP